MRIHELKIWPMFYAEIAAGRKQWEWRSTKDRRFSVRDVVILLEWDPGLNRFTKSPPLRRQIVEIVQHGGFAARRLEADPS